MTEPTVARRWIADDRTEGQTLVELWTDDRVTVTWRPSRHIAWGPPTTAVEETDR